VTGRVAANADGMVPQAQRALKCRTMPASWPISPPVIQLILARAGTSALVSVNKEQPMNAIPSEKLSPIEENLATVAEVEAGIRDFVRGDVANLRRPASLPSTTDTAPEPSTEASVNNINSLIERVAEPSLTEIGNLISELESMREMLHAEGQRVQREISGYGQLSQAAMKSTCMIADSLSEWKRAAAGLRNG